MYHPGCQTRDYHESGEQASNAMEIQGEFGWKRMPLNCENLKY